MRSNPWHAAPHADRLRRRRERGLTPASQAELEALLQRVAALLECAGIRWAAGTTLAWQRARWPASQASLPCPHTGSQPFAQ